MGLPLRKYTGQTDVDLVVVCHEIIAEIMRMDKNNQGRNGRERLVQDGGVEGGALTPTCESTDRNHN